MAVLWYILPENPKPIPIPLQTPIPIPIPTNNPNPNLSLDPNPNPQPSKQITPGESPWIFFFFSRLCLYNSIFYLLVPTSREYVFVVSLGSLALPCNLLNCYKRERKRKTKTKRERKKVRDKDKEKDKEREGVSWRWMWLINNKCKF